mmetsp:Transcript_28816/g.43513  ORF Transcript_28816/g.43513 Transcript_28816/m.43513 type:complete len:286 (-) Transcript_28816:16-873(-)
MCMLRAIIIGVIIILRDQVTVTSFQQLPRRGSQPTKVAASLTFNCDSIHESDPIPSLLKPDQVMSFFKQPEQRNCAISGGNKNNFREVEITDKLFEEWSDRCKELGASEPDREKDIICKVETGETKLPGIKLATSVFVGTKLVEGNVGEYPWYEFTLINNEQRARGFGPAVRVFEKIMAGSKNKSCISSLSRLTAVTNADGHTVFKFWSDFRIIIPFPSIVLKILPVNKERVEKEGAEAIGKTLKKQTQSVLQTLQQTYVKGDTPTPIPVQRKWLKISKVIPGFK